MLRTGRAFTLIELLVVIGIIGLLMGLVLPAMSRARDHGRTLVCATHLHELGAGWQMYCDENDSVILPGRMFKVPGGKANPANWYDVGNGLKYRPRWVATMGAYVGIFAFNRPLTQDKDGIKADRQDYDNEVYLCPSEPTWNNERNYAYGYNHQFLGNARQTNNRFHNFPVLRHRIKASSSTVIAGDCMGTAAGFSEYDRGGYDRLGSAYQSMANHGWTLDPPRLTETSDRGTGAPDSPRTAVDPRHQGKANMVFADGHAAAMKDYDLGYRKNLRGAYVHYDPLEPSEVVGGGGESPGERGGGNHKSPNARHLNFDPDGDGVIDGSHNRLFSGTGRDDSPPDLPQDPGA